MSEDFTLPKDNILYYCVEITIWNKNYTQIEILNSIIQMHMECCTAACQCTIMTVSY